MHQTLLPGDKLVDVNEVIMGKRMESKNLAEQALHNIEAQFNASPDLLKVLIDTAMDAGDAHALMSRQTLGSVNTQRELLAIILRQGRLWEKLRARGTGAQLAPRGLCRIF